MKKSDFNNSVEKKDKYKRKLHALDDFFLDETVKIDENKNDLNTEIRISGIVTDSIVDGPGLRIAVFAQGCVHNCKGCHNPQTHDLKGGKITTVKKILDIIDKTLLLDGLTLTGGEPFLQVEGLTILANEAKKRGLSVLTFTGYTWEEIAYKDKFMPLINESDHIIDGRFEEKLRSLSLNFRGSTNQRIIDVKETLKIGEVVEIESF